MEIFKLFGNIAINFRDAIADLGKVDRAAGDVGDSATRAARRMDDEFDKAASGAKRSTGGLFSHLGAGLSKIGSIGLGVGAIADIGAKAMDFIKDGVQGVREAEVAQKALETVIKSTGNAAGVSKEKLVEFADGIQETTKFSAEQVNEGQKLLLTFTKIGAKDGIFDRATQAALDMATTLKTNVAGASMLVGKALNDPIKGLTALSRSGVQFTAEQKETIKTMVKMGDTAGAQKIILKELETQFGGSAKAAGETFAGKMERAQNALGEMAEEVASNVIPYIDRFLEVITKNMPRIQRYVTIAADIIGRALEMVGGLLDAVTKLLDGDFSGAWKAVQGVIGKVWEVVVGLVKGGAALVVKAMTALGAQMVQVGADILAGVWKGITGGLEALKNKIGGVANDIVGWFKGALGIKSPSTVMIPVGGFIIAGLIAGMEAERKKILDRIKSIANELVYQWYHTMGARFGDGVQATISMVERTAGPFESYADGMNKLFAAGVKVTLPMIEAMRERFPEAARATTDAAVDLEAQAEQLAASLRDLDEEGLRRVAARAAATGDILTYNAVLEEMKRRADDAAKSLRELTDEIKNNPTPRVGKPEELGTTPEVNLFPALKTVERIPEAVAGAKDLSVELKNAGANGAGLNDNIGFITSSMARLREVTRLTGGDLTAVTLDQIAQLETIRDSADYASEAWVAASQEIERLRGALRAAMLQDLPEFAQSVDKNINVPLGRTAHAVDGIAVGSGASHGAGVARGEGSGSGGGGLQGVVEYAGKATEALKKIGGGDVLGALLDVAEFVGNMIVPGLGSAIKGVATLVQSLANLLFPPSQLEVMTQGLAAALEAGVRGGFASGIRAFLEGKDGIGALYAGLKSTIINAIAESLVAGAMLSSGIKALTDKLGAALASGNQSEAQSLIAQIGATAKGVMEGLAPTLTGLKTALDTAFPDATSSVTAPPAAPVNPDAFLASNSASAQMVIASNAPERLESAAARFENASDVFSAASGAFSTVINRLVTEGVRVNLGGGPLDGLAGDLRGLTS